MTEKLAADAAANPADEPLDPPPADQGQDESEKIWAEIQAGKQGEPADPPEARTERHDEPGEDRDGAADAQPPAQADIWADATPEQKAAFEAAAAERDRMEQKFRSATGRISALQRKINTHAAREQQGRDTASARESLAGIKDDYPEIAKPIEDALAKIEGKLDTISSDSRTALEADQAELAELVEAETRRLTAVHADYADVLGKNGPAFKAWLDDQPRRIRDAASRNANYIADGEGAIEVITGFKTHLGLIQPPAGQAGQPPSQPSLNARRERQLDASASPPRAGGRATVSGIPAEGDPQAIWDAIQAEKERKRR